MMSQKILFKISYVLLNAYIKLEIQQRQQITIIIIVIYKNILFSVSNDYYIILYVKY